MAEPNPTSRLAEQSRASYQKVDQAQTEKIQAGEAATQRTVQGIQQGGQALVQESQFGRNLQAQKEESQARLGQQQKQFEAEQGLQKQKLKQDQAQFEAQKTFETQKATRGFALEEGKLQLGERQAELDRQKMEQEDRLALTKLKSQEDERLSKEYTHAQEERIKRQDYYRGERDRLRNAKEKILFARDDNELTSNITKMLTSDLKDNKPAGAAASKILSGQVDPLDVKTLTDAIDSMMVKTMVDQAYELGEWSPPPHMVDHPDVKLMNTFMETSKAAFNQNWSRQINSAMMEGNAAQIAAIKKLHGDPDERDKRISRAGSRAMQIWYRSQNMRDALIEAGNASPSLGQQTGAMIQGTGSSQAPQMGPPRPGQRR